MQALCIVLQHTGTQNRKKLQAMVKSTKDLEYTIKLKSYQENMNAWSLANSTTIQIVSENIIGLEQINCSPFNPNATNNRGFSANYLTRFNNREQIKYSLQMFATRGYTCLICSDGVRFQFGMDDYTSVKYLDIFHASPNPDLVLPTSYPKMYS
jgi:hypothetical protein